MNKVKFASILSKENLLGLRELSRREGNKIYFHLNRAIKTYLNRKKVAGNSETKI